MRPHDPALPARARGARDPFDPRAVGDRGGDSSRFSDRTRPRADLSAAARGTGVRRFLGPAARNSERVKTFDLSGKTAIVTGGSRGLGLSIAEAFAEHGANLVIASRKLDACEKAAGDIASRTGRRVLPLACHVGNWKDCERLVAESYTHFGRIDVLVNNAGMSPLYPSLEEVSEDLWDKV